MRFIFWLITLLSCVSFTTAVERAKFKSCSQSSFCNRNRNGPHGPFRVSPSLDYSAFESHGHVKGLIQNSKYPLQKPIDLLIDFLHDDIVRIRITELNGLYKRFQLDEVLVPGALKVNGHLGKCLQLKGDVLSCKFGNEKEIKLSYNPFRLKYFIGGKVIISLNDEDLLNFEPYRNKNPRPQPITDASAHNSSETEVSSDNIGETFHEVESYPGTNEAEKELIDQAQFETNAPEITEQQNSTYSELEFPFDDNGMWDEYFSGGGDSKLKGPASFGLDIKFAGSSFVYGLPEHATKFALPNTKGGDPYRLYNLDVFKYELDEPMALYGSIPLAVSHKEGQTCAVYWNNAAETYIDVSDSEDAARPGKTLHFMSESGTLDLFIIPGSTPSQVFSQYSTLTGFPTLPQKFAVAYHQCRWNYKDEADVANVDGGFDEHGIPYDVLWLDIEHTDGKKYFTWDKTNFPNPTEMQNKIASKGRKMVTIIDPHIKRDSSYHIHSEAYDKGYYVKNKDGNDFEGWCWPGSSSYLDFLRPEVREFWISKFEFGSYEGSTPVLYTWNDMNEPSVFNGPEVTMHKDCLHRGDVEHRDVHNLYGFYVHQSTFEGHLRRSNNNDRPFVLSRAFFAGSQRFGAVWTGDNMAQWSHLAYSVPMLLSLGVAGLPFVGADVGGFFDNPETELLIRWYQAGAFQPFFRAHAHIETSRREPWLFGDETTALIRDAVYERYTYLPYIYTAFWNNSFSAIPIMRPMWVEFPSDVKTFAVDDQYLFGSDLLVKPVTTKDCKSLAVYLPGTTVWYDVKSYTAYLGGITVNVPTPMNKIPVFQRGGSIIAKQERKRRSSSQMVNDPYTLVVALNQHGYAEGVLYLDDGKSLDYQKGMKTVRKFVFENNSLTGTSFGEQSFTATNLIEKILILGYKRKLSIVTNQETMATIQFGQNLELDAVLIKKPGLSINSNFILRFL